MKKHFVFTNIDAFNFIPPLLKDGLLISFIAHIFFLILIMVSPHINFSKKIISSFEYDEPIIVDLDNVIVAKETILPPPPKKDEVKANNNTKIVEEKKDNSKDSNISPTPKTEKTEVKEEVIEEEIKTEKDTLITSKEEKEPPKKDEKVQEKKEEVKSSVKELLASVDKIKEEKVVEVKKGIQSLSVDDDKQNSSYQPNATADYLRKQLSVSYVDAIRIKLRSCWNIDPGAKDIQNMKIVIKTTLAPDGNISDIDILNIDEYKSSPWFKVVAESARRALIVCSPYNLPVEYYQDWKNIVFTFYPDKKSVQ